MTNIKIENLSFAYRDHSVLEKINLSFDNGRAYRIFGPNGAGKTTLLKLINRDLFPDGGSVSLRQPEDRQLFLSDKNVLDPHLSFNDHLSFLKAVGQLRCSDEFLMQLADHLAMRQHLATLTAELSLGMQKKMTFMLFLAQEPKILILDEFFSGIDAAGMAVICEYLAAFVKKDNTLLFVTHADAKLFHLEYDTISL